MKRLARALKINRAWAVGIMESLWHFAGRFAQQGDVGKFQDVDIAEAVFWEGDPTELITALVDSGWVDRDGESRLMIHDWEDHADDAVRKFLTRNRLQFKSYQDKVETCPDSVETRLDSPPDHAAGAGALVQALAKAKAVETETELPNGFPKTLEEAISQAQLIGCSHQFVDKTWNKAMGRGGRDSRDVPIMRFANWLTTEWKYEQERMAKQKPAKGERTDKVW